MKAAAISELYLLNENTNGSGSSLAGCQGRQHGVGGDDAGSRQSQASAEHRRC